MTEPQDKLLGDFAEQQQVPGAGAGEMHAKIVEIMCNKNLLSPAKNSMVSEIVVAELEKRGGFFYHAQLRDFASAMFFDGKRKILHPVQSDQFQSWLSQWIRINRASPLFPYVLKEIENAALNGPGAKGILPEHYWARRDKNIYMSMGDGEMLRITSGRVEPVDNGADGVLFACGRTLRKWNLVAPTDPFQVCRLFSDMNSAAAHGKHLLQAWAMSLPSDPSCKPPLAAIGPVGSGKTRIARGVAELYGLPEFIVKADENGERDFWNAINEGGIFVLDNADTDIKWLPDALAAAATKGSVVRRRLYKDFENVQLIARSWVVITSANPSFASDAGLADRLLAARMNRRTGNTSEGALTEEILANRDAGLSFVANALSKALADSASTPPGLNSRHPDFAAFAVRIGRAVGLESQFVAALRTAEADKSQICVESDSIGSALLALVAEHGQIKGTASDFVNLLTDHDPRTFERLNARKVSNKLGNLWPHLEGVLDAAKTTVHGGILEYTLGQREG